MASLTAWSKILGRISQQKKNTWLMLPTGLIATGLAYSIFLINEGAGEGASAPPVRQIHPVQPARPKAPEPSNLTNPKGEYILSGRPLLGQATRPTLPTLSPPPPPTLKILPAPPTTVASSLTPPPGPLQAPGKPIVRPPTFGEGKPPNLELLGVVTGENGSTALLSLSANGGTFTLAEGTQWKLKGSVYLLEKILLYEDRTELLMRDLANGATKVYTFNKSSQI
ncbi:hypothetical protein [Anthocerotibacter panamensis]|uniref:hypothetical protein n=1 Tax=Anthocerotibacter panamensis TaxID=2857077 RepID=UPI001C403365|nr:hypothetical protein [Anthocerotibacter panamensis]